MLYVVLTNGVEHTWHVNAPISGFLGVVNLVAEVQADGHELEWIQKNITGIPQCMLTRVQTWFGDDAKFIANCLPQK